MIAEDFVRLDAAGTTLALALGAHGAQILYFGASLPANENLAMLARLLEREPAPNAPAKEPALVLCPQLGAGFAGHPGLLAHRGGQGFASFCQLDQVRRPDPFRLELSARDAANGLLLAHSLALHPQSGVLEASCRLENLAQTPLSLDWLAPLALPVPPWLDQILSFEGRWAGEFQRARTPRRLGLWMRENRRGRTSHDSFPALLLESLACSEQQGEALALHLGWSGNHRLLVDTLVDGRAQVQLGELLLPGEMQLAAGQAYETPKLYAAMSDRGRNGAAMAFQRWVRARPAHERLRRKPRPLHYNTWEALYFAHDLPTLFNLAERAAALGLERFVLDDGWFLGRRSDRAGLGDWTPDPSIYPDGLAPLIARVQELGMEFGLWIEPEMVNADSELFRAHPDWVLQTPPAPQLDFRHQLVLDFGREAVRAYVFQAIDALLRKHAIAYLKWDMNRDLSHPGDANGRAGTHAHVAGVYQVLEQLRAAHPEMEIESCASGGGRADYGALACADRFWTSDSNDAIERLEIQSGFALFFPAELMGAHVGPDPCHITGRRLSMRLRVATSLFGHMGVEADLGGLSPQDCDELAAGLALHKRWRALLHTGERVRLDAPPEAHAFLIISEDRAQALLSYTQIAAPRAAQPPRIRLAGLDPARIYRLALIWPVPSPPAETAAWGQDWHCSGASLMLQGIAPPRLHPETAVIMEMQAQPSESP